MALPNPPVFYSLWVAIPGPACSMAALRAFLLTDHAHVFGDTIIMLKAALWLAIPLPSGRKEGEAHIQRLKMGK
jgi:hypothetical protein